MRACAELASLPAATTPAAAECLREVGSAGIEIASRFIERERERGGVVLRRHDDVYIHCAA